MGRLTAVAAILFLVATGCGNDTVEVQPAPEATEAPAASTAPETTTTTEAPAAESPSADLSPSELLLASIEATTGRAVRGQMRTEGGMVEDSGGAPVVDFQTDAQGNSEALLSDPSGEQIRVRIVDGQTYAGFPGALAVQLFPDFQGETAWLTVGPEFAGNFAIPCASPLAALGTVSPQCDPAADLRGLADAAEEATVVGDEELRGVSTTHLQFVVPMSNLPSTGGDLGGALAGNLSVDVWIDDDTLLRKLVVDLGSLFGGFADAFGAEDGAADIEMPTLQSVIEYYDFDDSISIEAPAPESLIADYAEIQPLLQTMGIIDVSNHSQG